MDAVDGKRLYAHRIDFFLMTEREADAWPKTHHLLVVQAFMSTHTFSSFENRGYQHLKFLCVYWFTFLSIEGCRGGYTGTVRTIQRQLSQGVHGVGGMPVSFRRDVCRHPTSARHDDSESLTPPIQHSLYLTGFPPTHVSSSFG